VFRKILITTLIIGFVTLIGGVILIKGDFNKVIAAFTYQEDYEFIEESGEEKVEVVNLNLIANNVNIYYSEDETYNVSYYSSENDRIVFSFYKGILSLEGKRKLRFGFINKINIKSQVEKQVNIYLPKDFSGIVKGEIASGKLTIDDLNIEKVAFEITSGSIFVNNTKIKEGKIATVSGNINIEKSQIDNLKGNTTSGNININDITSDTIKIDTTSGNVTINVIGNKEDYKLDVNVTSGSIYLDGLKIANQILNENKNKLIELKITSGKGRINFSG